MLYRKKNVNIRNRKIYNYTFARNVAKIIIETKYNNQIVGVSSASFLYNTSWTAQPFFPGTTHPQPAGCGGRR